MKKSLHIDNLPITAVDTDSPIPLYHQIESDLRRLIANGIISPSDVLPPEIELSKAYGVGRHTMREALSRLVADDLITRKAGLGTVVNENPNRTQFFLDRSFSNQMSAMGRDAKSHVLDISTGTFDESHPVILHQYIGRPYVFLQRLRLGDNEPIGLQYTLLVRDLCPGIEEEDFHNASLYDILASRYQISIAKMDYAVSAEKANDLHAEMLGIEPEALLLLVKTTTYIPGDRLIEFTRSHYRADRYEYHTTATFG